MLCSPQAYLSIWPRNSAALSVWILRMNPRHGQVNSSGMFFSLSQSSFGRMDRSRHCPVAWEPGWSSEIAKPTIILVQTSIAIVRYARPIGFRSSSSTRIASIGVWSICTTASG